MRARDFIKPIAEARTGPVERELLDSLPATYIIPQLKNSDAYYQYRFGVAIAGAKGAKKRQEDGVQEFSPESLWGENEIVVSYGQDMGPIIDDALKSMGLKGKNKITQMKSVELKDTSPHSPLKPFKGYKRR